MRDSQMPKPTESPEDHRPGFFYVYEIYFKGCGLTFSLPGALVRYLSALEIALPQLTPYFLRSILGIITIATEAGYVIGVPELNELLSVRSFQRKSDTSRLIRMPTGTSSRIFLTRTRTGITHAFIASTLPTAEFAEFFKIVIEGETLWNSFTFDSFIKANHKLRTSLPEQLLQLPLPPPLPHRASARAIAT
ncbi:hypothetical protein AXX17_ATUG05030 [Arabidopsis thaliana]|uniref:Uncharacterized protein n=1 Tax=Arabidopsis thaliana TaxID=3702 RepID=A0A178U7H4_ARATH|nr:hypothetical protein AXX17_ATUG05030 [Arabidopsis thaliana]